MAIKNRCLIFAAILVVSLLQPISSVAQPSGDPLNEIALDLLPTGSGPYSFAVVADTHATIDSGLSWDLQQILGDISANSDIVFVFHLGDSIELYSEDVWDVLYDDMSEWMDSTDIPIFQVPGNHEFMLGTSLEKFDAYFEYVGDPDIHFRYGESLFFITNDAGYLVNASSEYCSADEYYHDTCPYNEMENANSEPYDHEYEKIFPHQIDDIEQAIVDYNLPLPPYCSEIFSFTHVPVTPRYPYADYPGYEEFRDMLENEGFTANFSGHKHPPATTDTSIGGVVHWILQDNQHHHECAWLLCEVDAGGYSCDEQLSCPTVPLIDTEIIGANAFLYLY